MAYTRIHAIKATVDKSIAYICNPGKTDGELYVSSFGCSAKTAHLEFAFANGKNIKTGDKARLKSDMSGAANSNFLVSPK